MEKIKTCMDISSDDAFVLDFSGLQEIHSCFPDTQLMPFLLQLPKKLEIKPQREDNVSNKKSEGNEKNFLEEMKLFMIFPTNIKFDLVESLEGLQIFIFLNIQKGLLRKK